ncbi:MAG: CNNM domain-containing protein, partial [bacterium]
ILTELEPEEKDSRFARELQYWLDNTQEILISILIGNNIVNIGASSLATVVSTEIFRDILGLGSSLSRGAAVATGAMTLIILVFGEISPKSYAKQNPELFSQVVLPPIIAWNRFLHLILAIHIMRLVSRAVIWVFGGKMPRDETEITEEELKTLV